ncbi:MAG: hypothetical protein AABY34_07300 [Pseudomonadota bacterium]
MDFPFELVAVDYLAQAFVEITSHVTSYGKVFHLLPPTRAEDLGFSELFDMVSEVSGTKIKGVDYKEWLQKVEKWCEIDSDQATNSLFPLLPFLANQVYKGMTVIELYQHYPSATATNALQELEGTAISHRKINPKIVETYLRYLCGIGFIEEKYIPRLLARSAAEEKARQSALIHMSLFVPPLGARAGDGAATAASAAADETYAADDQPGEKNLVMLQKC